MWKGVGSPTEEVWVCKSVFVCRQPSYRRGSSSEPRRCRARPPHSRRRPRPPANRPRARAAAGAERRQGASVQVQPVVLPSGQSRAGAEARRSAALREPAPGPCTIAAKGPEAAASRNWTLGRALGGPVAGFRGILGPGILDIFHMAIETVPATPAAAGSSVEMDHNGIAQAAVMRGAQIPSSASRTTHDNVRVSSAQNAFSILPGIPTFLSRYQRKVFTRTTL